MWPKSSKVKIGQGQETWIAMAKRMISVSNCKETDRQETDRQTRERERERERGIGESVKMHYNYLHLQFLYQSLSVNPNCVFCFVFFV